MYFGVGWQRRRGVPLVRWQRVGLDDWQFSSELPAGLRESATFDIRRTAEVARAPCGGANCHEGKHLVNLSRTQRELVIVLLTSATGQNAYELGKE